MLYVFIFLYFVECICLNISFCIIYVFDLINCLYFIIFENKFSFIIGVLELNIFKSKVYILIFIDWFKLYDVVYW